MKKHFLYLLVLFAVLLTVGGCQTKQTPTAPDLRQEIAIFSINDPHGRLSNFPKIKPLLTQAKQDYDAVFFVSAGDLFSGNPIVDFYPEKGYPIIDFLNALEMDVSVIGNHEFDYGQDILAHRIAQASFPFICANVSGGPGALGQVVGAVTVEKNGIRLAFVGVVETSSPKGQPLTHPKKIQQLDFQDGDAIFSDYATYKEQNNANILVALTHQGEEEDADLLRIHPYIDLVIGGHTNQIYGQQKTNGFMVMAGKHLETLGKTTIVLVDGEPQSIRFESIDLQAALPVDADLEEKANTYANAPEFYKTLGTAAQDHNRTETACFYVKAIREETQADLVIQNSGGVRNNLEKGTITPFAIYSIDPFGNGLDTYTMTVGEVQNFLSNYRASFSYDSEFQLVEVAGNYQLLDASGEPLPQEQPLQFALNDYITNVYEDYFPLQTSSSSLTTADFLIRYVSTQTSPIDFTGCDQKE